MKTLIGCRVLIIAALSVAGTVYAADGEAVGNPAKRQEVLDASRAMLATKPAVVVGKDPFHSEAYAESVAASGQRTENPAPTSGGEPAKPVAASGPRSPRDLLQAIAASPSLKPSGFFVLGGKPTLVFGQKRVNAGGTLTITFEGTEYTLEIASIDRPNFTLRLNREEFTRPIK
jgi:hypothetical protein